jgi:hypothetical protein
MNAVDQLKETAAHAHYKFYRYGNGDLKSITPDHLKPESAGLPKPCHFQARQLSSR